MVVGFAMVFLRAAGHPANIYEMAFYSVCVLSQGEAVKICKLCNNALEYLIAA
jgi:hypothetical protein